MTKPTQIPHTPRHPFTTLKCDWLTCGLTTMQDGRLREETELDGRRSSHKDVERKKKRVYEGK